MAKVLVVDDSLDIARLLAFTLKGQGHDVSVAYGGREALEIAFAERPDVILLDVMMPEMDGIEVCKHLRANPDLRTTPVILVTAKDRDEDFVAGLDAGADDYVTKPFIAEVVAARVRAAVRAKQFRDEMARMNDQLRQSQKMEAVGCLAGGIAHEFNNLLQAIGGYTTCAMTGLSPQEDRYADLQTVLKATARAVTLTRQLLGFSRRRTLQLRNIDPNEAVTDLTKLVRPLISEQIELETVLADDAGTVYADAGELQQVLLNLCLNARDAMPSGGKLLLKTERVVLDRLPWDLGFETQPGPYVLFTITDTGCGMPFDVRQRIFEPFFSTKEVGKGSGLGLAMVYGSVRQHGGAIQVASEPGKGTTFKVYLPAGGVNNEEQLGAEARPALRGIETILLAEDESLVRSLAVRTLEKAGYTVLAASDGEEALRLFEENHAAVSLLILDAVMPKLTGHDVYQRIKAVHPDTKIILCTGYDPETAQAGFFAQENVRVIEKPFDAQTLLRAVREVLDARLPCQLVAEASA